ncbi:MAG: DUF1573 domain-containing protein [Deltaproteobacteria bacterium]|nr:DUF1573 domain-containing protein [Deltaproteobacteria bacterium]MBW2072242.1 DUF1573 domain-containing protein [Deltaproteobacteria bacterium]
MVTRVKQWPAVLILISAVLLGFLIQVSFAASGKPHMVFSAPTFDAGNVWEGAKISHTFEVRNSGDAELKIYQVKPG